LLAKGTTSVNRWFDQQYYTCQAPLLHHSQRRVEQADHVLCCHAAAVACLTHEDAEEVLSEVPYIAPLAKHSSTSGISVQTAEQLLASQQSCKRIMTFCKELDDLLGGGVACGHVTEFVGVPGVGKTQLGWVSCTTTSNAVVSLASGFSTKQISIRFQHSPYENHTICQVLARIPVLGWLDINLQHNR
jgi:predicted ATP-dependent serine protease